MKWAKSLFDDWLASRNKKAVDSPDLRISPIMVKLDDMTIDELNYSIVSLLRFNVLIKESTHQQL